MLAADAASTSQLRAGERVLKAARAARTLCGLDALRLPSGAPLPALHTACRRRSAQEATPAVGRLFNVPLPWLCAGRFAAIQGGFLRSRFGSGGPHAWRLRSRHPRARGHAPAPWTGASRMPAPPALQRPPLGWGTLQGQHRRRPVLPAVLSAAAQTHPPALPREGSESPSAVSGARPHNGQAPPTASVVQRATASRPSPRGRPVAGLDSAACRRVSHA